MTTARCDAATTFNESAHLVYREKKRERENWGNNKTKTKKKKKRKKKNKIVAQVSSAVESTPAIYIRLKSRPSKMNRASRLELFRVPRQAFRKTAAMLARIRSTTEISGEYF